MIKIEDKPTVFFDVDDTLVLWFKNKDYSSHEPHPGNRPFTLKNNDYPEGVTFNLVPHVVHIELIKKYKDRNYNIVVWSAGGADWAEAVVKQLELESYVDLVMSKPLRYVDDLNCKVWMGERVYHKL